MEDHSFSYEILARNAVMDSDNLIGVAALDVAAAKNATGYGFLAPRPPSGSVEEPGFADALFGEDGGTAPRMSSKPIIVVESAGCIGTANRSIYGSLAEAEWAFNIQDEFHTYIRERLRTSDTPEMTAAVAAYSQCMHAAGYDFSTVDETLDYAQSHYALATDSASPSPEESALFAADLACQEDSDYVGTFDASALEIGEPWIESHGADLDRLERWRDEIVHRIGNDST